MIPTLGQVCSLHAAFDEDVREYAAGKVSSIEIWMTKLEQFLTQHSVEDVHALLKQQGMQAPVASFQGGLFQPPNVGFDEAWALFEKRLDLCQAVGIGTLVVAGDIHDPISDELIQRVLQRLRDVAGVAGDRGVEIAWEFQADATFGNNLATALALVQDVGSPALGICLDSFHFCVGPSKESDLMELTAGVLKHVQLCDVPDLVRELAHDGERILPGEGDFKLDGIVDRLAQIQYQKAVSVEVLNPQLWQVPPRQFGEIAITSLRRQLRLTESNKTL